MTMIADTFPSIAASPQQGGKKESTGLRLSQLCPPCATPSSNPSPDPEGMPALQKVDQQQAAA
jgi:hypothetical protein